MLRYVRTARERVGDSTLRGQLMMSRNIQFAHGFDPQATGVFAVGFNHDRFADLPLVCRFTRGHITPGGSLCR